MCESDLWFFFLFSFWCQRRQVDFSFSKWILSVLIANWCYWRPGGVCRAFFGRAVNCRSQWDWKHSFVFSLMCQSNRGGDPFTFNPMPTYVRLSRVLVSNWAALPSKCRAALRALSPAEGVWLLAVFGICHEFPAKFSLTDVIEQQQSIIVVGSSQCLHFTRSTI